MSIQWSHESRESENNGKDSEELIEIGGRLERMERGWSEFTSWFLCLFTIYIVQIEKSFKPECFVPI